MSTIGVTYHDEDIHNIIHKPMSPIIKSPRYKSKRKFVATEKKKYNGHQTFGLAHYEPPESHNFLKKGRPKPSLPSVQFLDKKEFKCTVNCKRSPVPKCTSNCSKKEKKNFVKENIKKIGNIEPKLPPPRKVETPKGTVRDMAHLLQMIRIRQSDKYGKIPKYLCERRKQWAMEEERRRQEEQAIRQYKEKMGIGSMGLGENVYMIDQETRQKLLDGLKENWNELSKQFLKLPVMIDTWTKIRRKMYLEREIDQLEKDVKLVESHPYIYLERHDRRPYGQILADMREQEELEKQVKENDKEEKPTEPEPAVEVTPEQPPPQEEVEEKKEEDEELKILNY